MRIASSIYYICYRFYSISGTFVLEKGEVYKRKKMMPDHLRKPRDAVLSFRKLEDAEQFMAFAKLFYPTWYLPSEENLEKFVESLELF